MQDIQTAEGYLPREQLRIAGGRELGVPLSRIYSVATFYASFRLQPKGEHTITLCMGTVCYLKGADQIAAAIQEEFQVAPRRHLAGRQVFLRPGELPRRCCAGAGDGGRRRVLRRALRDFGRRTSSRRLPPASSVAAARRQGRARRREKEVSVTTARLESAADLAEYRAQLLDRGGRAATARAGVHRHRLHGQGRPPGAGTLRRNWPHQQHHDVRIEAKCTGCHGFCERGPIVVVDPGNVFYQGVKTEDVAGNLAETALGGATGGKALVSRTACRSRPARPKKFPSTSLQQRIVLAHNGVVDPTSIDDYIAAGGYAALAKVLAGMTPEGRDRGSHPLGPARPRRRRLPHRAEMARRPRRPRRAEVRDRQRRRRRPRRLHGPLAHGGLAAQRAGGHDHRRLRHRLLAGIYLCPARVSHGGRAPCAWPLQAARERGCWARTSWAAVSVSISA